MSSRGWESVTPKDLLKRELAKAPKPSKYRNVRVTVAGETFDSKKEAAYWQGLKAREKAGEISNLVRQWRYDLMCPDRVTLGSIPSTVCHYVADFVYWDRDGEQRVHVVDVKSPATRKKDTYILKKKWMWLQNRIEIEEV